MSSHQISGNNKTIVMTCHTASHCLLHPKRYSSPYWMGVLSVGSAQPLLLDFGLPFRRSCSVRWLSDEKGVKLRSAEVYGTLCAHVTAAFKSIYDTIPCLSGGIRPA